MPSRWPGTVIYYVLHFLISNSDSTNFIINFFLSFFRMDFNSDEEKALIEQVFMNAIEALSEDDQSLPQV